MNFDIFKVKVILNSFERDYGSSCTTKVNTGLQISSFLKKLINFLLPLSAMYSKETSLQFENVF